MKIILDTHIFLWALAEPRKIAKEKVAEIKDLSNTIYVSSITIAELMIKASLNKLRVDFDPVALAEASGFQLLDFTGADAALLKDMPFYHKDPFDRMLIAPSIAQNISIMSDDSKFRRYDCKVI